jgi:hypothetical protein
MGEQKEGGREGRKEEEVVEETRSREDEVVTTITTNCKTLELHRSELLSYYSRSQC